MPRKLLISMRLTYSLSGTCLQALFGVSIACAQSTPVAPRITEALDEARLVRLRGNVHPLARPEFDRGAASPSLRMDRMQLVLTRSAEQESALRVLLEAQQDKSSASFHRWLAPEEFGRQFGPSDQDIQVVASWLQSHGFQVNRIANGRTAIEFSGTAGQVLDAFHTEIHKFIVNGEERWANTGDPRIPDALASTVAGPATLHNFRAKSNLKISNVWPRIATRSSFRPQYNEANGSHALTPADYAVIYNIDPLYKAGITGSGVTIAVIGVAPVDPRDIADFRSVFHLPKNPPLVVVNGTSPDHWQYDVAFNPDVEGTLDLSWAGAIAPKATVKFILSDFTDTTNGLDLSEQYAVDNNVADIVTESFGICESDMTQAYTVLINSLRQQAAAQGITYVVSSGDSGGYECYGDPWYTGAGPLSISALAASPYVVAVGGTEFSNSTGPSSYWAVANTSSVLSSALSYLPETVWNDSCAAAKCGADNQTIASSGGGPSTLFTKPSWQSGVLGIPADGARDVPDVSLTASAVNVPYLLCYAGSCQGKITSDSFMPVGGTSASAPSFAGVMALVVQKTKSRQGQANYVLYRLAASQQYTKCDGSNIKTPPQSSCVFNDVTAGNNAVPGEPKYGAAGALYQAGAAYDLATGLGSINVTNLVKEWESVTFNPTATTLTISPTTLQHGAAANVQIAVAPQNGTGTPTGDVSLLPSAGPAREHFSLTNGAIASTTASLPGGTYTAKAHYAGDATFAPSDSAPISVTILPEPSTTTAAILVAPVPNAIYAGGVYGSASVRLSARIAGRSGQGSPIGSVTFTDNGAPIGAGVATLNTEGQALSVDTNIVLTPGQHSIVAAYSGDASFQPSFSAPAVVTITKAPSTTSVQPNVSNVQAGKPVTLTATIETGSATTGNPATGTVTFSVGATPLAGPVRIKDNFDVQTGQFTEIATLAVSTLPVGTSTITAVYSGDANYIGSTSAPTTVKVSTKVPACVVTSFTADPSVITLFDPPATTTLTVNAGCQVDVRVGNPKGTVLARGTGMFTTTVTKVTNGMTFYLQEHGNFTAQGTLQTLTIGAQSGSLPCVVYSFAASPNPIISPTLVGTTTLTVIAGCDFDIRIGAPDGTLVTSGQGILVETSGPWVTNGMTFFLQQRGNTTAQGTLSTVTVSVLASAPLCVVTDFSADPNPITASVGGLGATTINVNAACLYDVRLNSPSGSLLFSGAGPGSQNTGPSVSNGMKFYLQMRGDTTPQGTLESLKVAVQ